MRTQRGFVLLSAALLAVAGCTKPDTSGSAGGTNAGTGTGKAEGGKSTLTIRGSDTMLQLSQEWVQAFNKAHPEITVSLNGGGSGTGIKALENKSTDIANASRPVSDKEKDSIAKGSAAPQENIVAQDAVAIIVNPGNSVKELTLAQLKDIYTGKVTNWSQVGGPNMAMVVSGRDSSSGTYKFFQEHVLNKEAYAPTVQALAATNALVQSAEQDKGAIGYVGLGYLKPSVKAIPIKKDAASPAVEAKVDNVLNKTYPLARPLFEYTAGDPSPAAKTWLDWVKSKEGQGIVEKQGFVPVGK